MVTVRIADLPEPERPRERLLAHGVEALSHRELLALVLRNGRRGESALDLASVLLAREGGLAGLAALRPEDLARLPGVGPAKGSALVAAFRLGRLAHGVPDGVILRSDEDIARIALRELAGTRRERILVLVCDSGNRMRYVVPVSEGSIDKSILPIREVLNAILRHDGRAFAVAHNHPSGDPTPSDSDMKATGSLREAADLVGVRFLAHVIVAGRRWAACPHTPKASLRTEIRTAATERS